MNWQDAVALMIFFPVFIATHVGTRWAMEKGRTRFRCRRQRRIYENVDTLVAKWHNGAGRKKSLAQYLGLTDFEYSRWVETGEWPEWKTGVR